MESIRDKRTRGKTFEEFGIIQIVLPDKSEIEIDLKKLLAINKDLPPDVLTKLSTCSIYYAKYGIIKADLETFLNLKREELDMFMKEKKNESRAGLTTASSETKVEEKAILENRKPYMAIQSEIRNAENSLEKLKRILYSLEILAENARSIISYSKREWEMIGNADPVIKKSGNLKNRG